MVETSIIIPAFNAAHCIRSTCVRTNEYMLARGCSYEIIVVDDGSTDGTRKIVLELQGKIQALKKINLEKNSGKGYSVRTGMLAACGRRRLFMDADHSTDISHLAAASKMMDKGFDIVIASRSPGDADGARQATPERLHRRIAGNAGNYLIQAAGLRGIHDTQCGFKLFDGDVARRLFEASRIRRWAFDVEILMMARRLGLKIGIIPAEWHHNPRSSISPMAYIGTLKDLAIIALSARVRKNIIW